MTNPASATASQIHAHGRMPGQWALYGPLPMAWSLLSCPFGMWFYPLPALFARCGWVGAFVTPALQPHAWQYMAYAFGTIITGFAAFLVLAWRKRDWPFLPPQPDMPVETPVFESEGMF